MNFFLEEPRIAFIWVLRCTILTQYSDEKFYYDFDHNITIIKMRHKRICVFVSNDARSTMFCSFRNKSIVLLILLIHILRCSLKFNLGSEIIPYTLLRWDLLERTVVKANGRMTYLSEFMGENNFLGLFVRFRKKIDFPLECPIAYFLWIIIQTSPWSIDIVFYGKRRSIACKELGICKKTIR